MTDPVADMLTRLRNANSAFHDTVSMPHSKLKSHIADILKAEGYIASWDVADATVGKTLTLNLKFGPNRERSIAGIKRVSKPGLRVYAKSTEIPKVLGGLGVAILWVGKSSPTCGNSSCRVLEDCPSRSPRVSM
jgi:small subunit ribosomal protein S8